MKNFLKSTLITALTCFLLSSVFASDSNETNVPDEFKNHYSQLESKLDSLDNYLTANWNGINHPTVFSTELLAASPNRGDVILESQVLEAIKLHLNAYMYLGVTGVSIDIKYPVLNSTFPRSSEYLEFFKSVTEEVRKRKFTLLIAIQSVFTDSIFGRQDIDFSGLTLEQYKSEKRQMAETVIKEMHPDYLTIETEPTTQARNTGLDFSVNNVKDIVSHVLNGLDRQTTLVGAGSGTWEDFAYIQTLAEKTSIDYLDVHIYPIHVDLVIDRMETIRQIADTNNKGIVIGESWLYKQSREEMSDPSVTYFDIFPRDVFDFWIPLDVKFIEMMVKLSNYLKFDFTSLFWMRYYWGYIEYNDTTKALSATQRYNSVDQIIGPNMLSGKLTDTGETYKSLITENTGIQDNKNYQPEKLVLYQNFPNPFNPGTKICFSINKYEHVSLNIYDINGRIVTTLIDNVLNAGEHSVYFHPENLPGGLYLYKLTTPTFTQTKKCIFMK